MNYPEKILIDLGTFWFWFLLFISFFGLVTHFLKKKIKGESVNDIRNYFYEHFRTVVLSFIVTLIGFFAYWIISGGNGDILGAFAVGFLSDSFLNKYDFAKENEQNFGTNYRSAAKR